MFTRIGDLGIAFSRFAILVVLTTAVITGCQDDTNKSSATPKQSAPVSKTMSIPAGTHVVASLETQLSTETNHTGDRFVATTIEPIIIDGKTVAPTGTKFHGSLRDVLASGRVSGQARMTLAYEEIVDSAGKSHSISAVPLTLQAASETKSDIEKIAAGGVLGAVIGGIAGGGKGAAIGAGAGAGAGTVLMLATKGDDVELNPGQKLAIHLSAAASIPVIAQR